LLLEKAFPWHYHSETPDHYFVMRGMEIYRRAPTHAERYVREAESLNALQGAQPRPRDADPAGRCGTSCNKLASASGRKIDCRRCR
jgi:hypothetical protein